MIIKRLELNSFGKFKDYDLDLKDGVNLIYGENESGKSTLHSFISGIFYGFLRPFTKKTIYSEDHENYEPLNSNLYRGNLEFELDGVIYRIERDFKKGHEKTLVYEKSTGEDMTSRVRDLSVGKVLQPGIYFFGLSDLVFKNTVFISQEGIHTDGRLADEVRDKLVNIATAKDENISVNKAVDSLDLQLREIGTERAYTSKYGILIGEITSKKTELRLIKEKRTLYNDWLEKAQVISEEIDKTGKNILEKDNILYQINKTKKFKLYKEALELEKQILLLGIENTKLQEFENIDVDVYPKAEYLDYDINNLKAQIKSIKSEMDDLEKGKNTINISTVSGLSYDLKEGIKVHRKKIKTGRTLVFSLLSLYLFLVLHSLGNNNNILLVGTQSILLILILLLFQIGFQKNAMGIKNTDLIKLNNRLEIGKDKISNLEEVLREKTNRLDLILNTNNQKSIETFKKSISQKLRFDQVQKELEKSKNDLVKILDGKRIENLKVNKEELVDIGIRMQNIDEEKILSDLENYKTYLDELKLDYKEYEVLINNLESEISKEPSLSEEILGLEYKKNEYDKKRSAILYATNRIKELSSEIQRDYAPVINKKVGHMLSEITNGKYKTVKIDKNLNVKILSEEGQGLLKLNKLSVGTIDQIYFSLRMGLTEEIINKNLPLVFDECFSHYDDKRLGLILQFLIQKYKKRQIILFTCHTREKRILDKIGIDYNYINLEDYSTKR